MERRKKLIVGVSGASGAPLAAALLRAVAGVEGWESGLILTRGAELTIPHETGMTAEEFCALAHRTYCRDALGADIASGSYGAEGMVVVPCSMKTLAGIACGYSDNLLLRAADVMLKERRRLVLCAREAPLSTIHLRNMLTVTEAGAVVLPPVLTYYHGPESIADMERQLVGKILDQFGIRWDGYYHWVGEPGKV